VNKILINLNEKLISVCDVRTMSYVTKQSIGFVCHLLFKSRSIEWKFMTMFKQAVM